MRGDDQTRGSQAREPISGCELIAEALAEVARLRFRVGQVATIIDDATPGNGGGGAFRQAFLGVGNTTFSFG